MQYKSVLAGLAAVFFAASASASCYPSHPIGQSCPSTSEGVYFCDTTCTDIIICYNGVTQLNNICDPGCCAYENGTPYCAC